MVGRQTVRDFSKLARGVADDPVAIGDDAPRRKLRVGRDIGCVSDAAAKERKCRVDQTAAMPHADRALELHIERPGERAHERSSSDHTRLRPAEHGLRVCERQLHERLWIDEHFVAKHGTVHDRLLEDAGAVTDDRTANDGKRPDLDVAAEHRRLDDGGRMDAAAAPFYRELLQHRDRDREGADVACGQGSLQGAERHPRPAPGGADHARKRDPDCIQVGHPQMNPARDLERDHVANRHAHVTHRVDAARKRNRHRACARIDDHGCRARQQRAHRDARIAPDVIHRIRIRATARRVGDEWLFAGELRQRRERTLGERELRGGTPMFSRRRGKRAHQSRARVEVVAEQQKLSGLDRIGIGHVRHFKSRPRARLTLVFSECSIRDRCVANEVAERFNARLRQPAKGSQRHAGGF